MKKVRYAIEAVFVFALFAAFKMMPAKIASACGAWIGRNIGTRLAASRKASDNLRHAFPEKTEDERAIIVKEMWDNLGRLFAEYPHLPKICSPEYMEVVGLRHLDSIGPDTPAILIGGHVANWETIPYFLSHHQERPTSCVYREPNNPYVAKLLDYCRNPEGAGIFIPKSASGTRKLVKTVKDNGRIAIFIDQKYNEGIPAMFMGRPAMTSTAFAQLATRNNAPILPVRVERLKGCHFRLTIYPPFYTEGRSDEAVVEQAHKYLEEWIRERPAQWLWLHRRWKSAALSQQQ